MVGPHAIGSLDPGSRMDPGMCGQPQPQLTVYKNKLKLHPVLQPTTLLGELHPVLQPTTLSGELHPVLQPTTLLGELHPVLQPTTLSG